MAEIEQQVLYLGRWVSRSHFRAFVYNNSGSRLVESYKDFSDLISSGVWFAEEKDIQPAVVVDIKTKRGRPCRDRNQQ